MFLISMLRWKTNIICNMLEFGVSTAKLTSEQNLIYVEIVSVCRLIKLFIYYLLYLSCILSSESLSAQCVLVVLVDRVGIVHQPLA